MNERRLENLINLLNSLIELNKSGTKSYKEIDLVLGEILNGLGINKQKQDFYAQYWDKLHEIHFFDKDKVTDFQVTYLQKQMYNAIIDLDFRYRIGRFDKTEVYYKRGTGATTNAVALALTFNIPIIVPTRHQEQILRDKFVNNFDVMIGSLYHIKKGYISPLQHKILICMDGITDEQVNELVELGFKVLHIKHVE
ncbi:hypothetical protein ABEV41_00270 [Geobacillus thermodenitrificans]|uniref:hypothetical protein n=1 Tax=Geobacillus thermodenitrificans TaxID=33940 RepID=UPI003D24EA4F